MIYVFHALFLGILFFLIANYFSAPHSKWIYYPALLVRLMAGLGIGYAYLVFYEGGDTYYYYQLAKEYNVATDQGAIHYLYSLFQPVSDHTEEPRTQFFVKLISPIALFTPDYWILSLYLSFFGFMGSWYFVRKISLVFPDIQPVAYYAYLFFPSVVIWSSGVLKDNLANMAMLICLGVFIGYYYGVKTRLWEWILLAAGILLLVKLRFYAAGFLIMGILIFSAGMILRGRNWRWKLTAVVIICLLGFVSMQFLHTWMRPERLPLTLYENHQAVANMSGENSVVRYPDFEPTYISLLRHMPMAILNGIFRPFPWEHREWISIIIRVENVFLLFFSILSLFCVKRGHFTYPVVITLFLILMLSGFLAISTPNFGTLSRYKSIFLPHLVFVISILPFRKFFQKNEVN